VIDHLRKDFGVEPVCRELGLSASAYRARKRRPPSARFCRDAEILVHIRRIHDESLGTYGAYRVYKQLCREGHQIARCTIERLMRTHGIEGVVPGRKRKTTLADPAASRPAGLVNGRFTADRPDALWVADISYVDTWEQAGSKNRVLTAGQQALMTLAYLKNAHTFAQLGAGFSAGTTTAWRYVNEAVMLLSARSPKLTAALSKAVKDGLPYVVLDGTLIPADRVRADRPLYSGKHKNTG
jgi:transposase InsO family protein